MPAKNNSLTIKNVSKARPQDPPRLSINGAIYSVQELQQKIQHAQQTPAGDEYTGTLAAIDDSADQAASPANSTVAS